MTEILASNDNLVEGTLGSFENRDDALNSANRPGWQQSMKAAIRSSRQLLDQVGLADVNVISAMAEKEFPVFAPLEYVARMKKGDLADPLLNQVLAVPQEFADVGGVADPVGDGSAEIVPGLLQKYQRRALLITSGACAIHCRYCFRRHFPYADAPTGMHGWAKALETIQADTSLDEIILSGGDPLSVSDHVLKQLIARLNSFSHLKRIRIHTRFPVVIPSRVCNDLLNWVESSRCAVYFVLHFNHISEIDSNVIVALKQLRQAGATLLNQSVLLRGVNDSFEAQRDLCLKLVDHHVLPYYLHQLDLVRGATHFEVSDEHALSIVESLRKALPGYAVPKLVREIAGQPHKTPL